MPEARKDLIDAATSHLRSGENRLTEVFATVLDAHDDLARALFERMELPVGDRFQVLTQEWVAPRCSPDLIVRSLASNGRRVSQLWSEHKTVSGFRHEQREDYSRELEKEEGEGCLLTITTEVTDEVEGQWRRMTWQNIGELVDASGRAWGGVSWRVAALAPDAPARERLLRELLWYLEDRRLAVVRPFTSDDVHVFHRFEDVVDTVEALVERIAHHIPDFKEETLGSVGDAEWWFHIEPPDGAWIHLVTPPFGAYCEVHLCADDGWRPQGTGEPAVGAGYTLSEDLHPLLSANDEWVDRLEEAGYTLEVWTGFVRCWRTKPLKEFVDAGDSIDSQARAIAEWGRAAIEALENLDPGELTMPEPRQRRRHRAQVAVEAEGRLRDA